MICTCMESIGYRELPVSHDSAHKGDDGIVTDCTTAVHLSLTFVSVTDTMSAVPNSAEEAVFQKSVFDQATATAVRG